MQVKDITDEFVLITDEQEIRAVGDSIGAPDIADEFGCLFVEINDGDYGQIWGCMSAVPWNDRELFDVDRYLGSERYKLELRAQDKKLCIGCGAEIPLARVTSLCNDCIEEREIGRQASISGYSDPNEFVNDRARWLQRQVVFHGFLIKHADAVQYVRDSRGNAKHALKQLLEQWKD